MFWNNFDFDGNNKLITINKLINTINKFFFFCSSKDREKMDFYEHLKEIRKGIGNKMELGYFQENILLCVYIYSTNSGNLDQDTQGNRATRGART